MAEYVAFLRGVNLGGKTIVRMLDLQQDLERHGFSAVRTYRASGNLRFRTTPKSPVAVARQVEARLRVLLGADFRAFVRTAEELATIVALDPFDGSVLAGATPYVTFLDAPPASPPTLPHSSPSGQVELLQVAGREIFSLGRRVEGRVGYPTELVERLASAPATSRNWSTVKGLLDV
jgi:uncharacterized protein (DUF1697 family)